MRNKTVVITGASGKIGSALLKYFSDQNYNVIGTYNLLESVKNQKSVKSLLIIGMAC